MRTLGKEVTRRFYKDENGYEELTQRWSELCNSEDKTKLTVAHHVLYMILRGRDWTKAVTVITNPVKIENGAWGEYGIYKALTRIHGNIDLSIFNGILSPKALNEIRELVPRGHFYLHKDIENKVSDPYPSIVEATNV